MDPVSQGVLGAAAPKSIAKPADARLALLLGFLAGMAPDLDVLIRSSQDPLLFLEYHRQFTHSLFFIPIGGAACAVVLHTLYSRRRGLPFPRCLLFCTLGYATHALLDSCTTYGTQLLWPFSDTRFAWNTVSVIDPLFTLPLALLVAHAAWRRKALFARLALAWAAAYLGLGLVQRERAEAAGWALAEQRGHQPLRLEAKPSFANLVLWKIVYETPGAFHVDAVRLLGQPRVFTGESVPALNVARDFPWLERDSQQARDIERFRWFSNGYVALEPGNPSRITDIRYSMLPHQVRGLWSIELSEEAGREDHVRYTVSRAASRDLLGQFRAMLIE